MCNVNRRDWLLGLAAVATAAAVLLASLDVVFTPARAAAHEGHGHPPGRGNGPCTISGCYCSRFLDSGSSVCGNCYHSWNVHR